MFEAELLQDRVDLVEDAWESTLGLAEAQTAGRQGDAGVSDLAGAGESGLIGMHDAVFGEDGVHRGFLVRRDVGNDEVRVRGDDEREAQRGGDLGEAGAILRTVFTIDDAAHVDVNAAVELAVALLVPAHVVFDGVKAERLGRGSLDARKAAHDFGAEAVEAHRLHGVFEAGVFALGAVAVVTLGGDDGFDGIDDIRTLRVKQRLAEEGSRVELAVAHAKAAADGDGVAFDFAIHDVRHEADVLRVDVRVIEGLDGHADLEFTREVKFAVDGIVAFDCFRLLADGGIDLGVLDPIRIDLFAVEPDVGIGGGAPEEALADLFGEFLRVGMHGVLDRRGRAHGVAHDIAAGAHRREAAVADIADDFLHAAFEHAVELDALAVGEAHVAHRFGAKGVVDHPLLGGDAAAGHFAADHEAPGLVLLFLGKLGTQVAVILLVGAVVLHEDVAVLRDARGAGISEKLGKLATEAGGGEFDVFDGGFAHKRRFWGAARVPQNEAKARLAGQFGRNAACGAIRARF